MEDETTTTPNRKTPGARFYLGAMAVYLLLVHGLSLATRKPYAGTPLGDHPEILAPTRALLAAFNSGIDGSPTALAATGLLVLYASMVGLFFVTRRLVKGPVWLGSLAASAFMAHPVKTEVLFEVVGMYYLVAAFLAILAVLAYLRLIQAPGTLRYLVALAIFAAACFPFCINAPLFGVLFLLEFYPATQETRRWQRLFPFLAVTTTANWFHMETLYSTLPQPDKMVAPLLLILYPVGLLPETVVRLQETPWLAWGWGLFAVLLAALAFAFVRNGAFRVCLLAILMFRIFPGAEPIDFTTLDGGGQLLFIVALAALALAGFSRWLMRFEAWGKPAVALTTMLCIVLFVLQFQMNRAWPAINAPHTYATPVPEQAGDATRRLP